LGWVRKFHLAANLQEYRWNKGGRLYSYPQNTACYQHVSEEKRLEMRIDGEDVVEIDISSSYLSIFYAWCDQQLDTDTDAYRGILGPTELDRQVAKFWINASFGNGKLLTRWTKEFKQDFQERLVKKGHGTGCIRSQGVPDVGNQGSSPTTPSSPAALGRRDQEAVSEIGATSCSWKVRLLSVRCRS